MHDLSKQDMRRLGRGDVTVEILVKLDKLDIGFFEYAKRDPDFRMFLKRVVLIKGNVPSCIALKRTQEWACDAMYFIIMEERKKAEEDGADDAAGDEEAEPSVESEVDAGPVFEGDNLIAF